MCLQDFVILLVDFITLGVSKDPRYRGPARECQVVYRGNGGMGDAQYSLKFRILQSLCMWRNSNVPPQQSGKPLTEERATSNVNDSGVYTYYTELNWKRFVGARQTLILNHPHLSLSNIKTFSLVLHLPAPLDNFNPNVSESLLFRV